MDSVPKKTFLRKFYRTLFLNRIEQFLPIPKVNPSVYQVLALVVSFLLLYPMPLVLVTVLVLLTLVFDWYDGSTARRHFKTSIKGYYIDVFVDRISEVLIFAGAAFQGISLGTFPVGAVFYFLVLINILLEFVSIKTKKHISLPLRFIYLLVLLYIWISA